MAWAWRWYSEPPQAPVGESVLGVAALELRGAGTVGVMPDKPIRAVGGGAKTKQALNLPASQVENPDIVVLDAVKIPASGDAHGYTVTPTLDRKEGKVETMIREDDLPAFRFRKDGFVWAGAGLLNGEHAARVLVVQNLASVKAVDLSLMASVDQPMGHSGVASAHGLGTFIRAGLKWGWGQ